MKLMDAPAQTAALDLSMLASGKAFTETLPVYAVDTQPAAFFTVKLYGIGVPATAAALKLTVMGLLLGMSSFVAAVMPVPETE